MHAVHQEAQFSHKFKSRPDLDIPLKSSKQRLKRARKSKQTEDRQSQTIREGGA